MRSAHAILPVLLSLAISSADAATPSRGLLKQPVPPVAQATLPSQLGNYQVEQINNQGPALANPWAVALLPDGSFLVTVRGGSLHRVSAAGVVSAPLTGMPQVWVNGQGGLLDVVLSPGFAGDQTIYFSYAEAGPNATGGTAVARATLGATSVSNVQVIFRQTPKLGGGQHFGSRIAFAPDGTLFVTTGDRGDRITAQKLHMLQGKVVRINPDGSIPASNPFRTTRIHRSIWSFGHRNPQGAAIDPRTGSLWTSEHGPLGGDEINRPLPSRNYGWPLTSHGNDYGTGNPYPEWIGLSAPGIEDPVRVWTGSSPGLSGMAFLVDQPASAWNNNLFVGMLQYGGRLARLTLDGETIVGEERLNVAGGARIRDVRAAADGRLYVLTDQSNGRLLRITPPAAD